MPIRLWFLCASLCIVSAQQNAVLMALPPLLAAKGHAPVLIGTLSAMLPLFTLVARLPGGLLYRPSWTMASLLAASLGLAATSALFAGVDAPWQFALLGALNGLFGGVLTTLMLPLFLEALPAGLSRPRAMGWYTGSVALGFAGGGYFAGYGADHWGFAMVFQGAAAAALPALLALGAGMAGRHGRASGASAHAVPAARPTWHKSLLSPDVAFVLLTAMFLNVLYKIPATFLPMQALAAGLTLTDVGMLMGVYALCNAVARPISGPFVERFGAMRTSILSLPAQALVLMLIAVLPHLVPLVAVVLVAGTLRALVMVSNAVTMTEAMDERRFSKGTASGLFNAAGDLGYILGPIFGGAMANALGVSNMFIMAPALVAGLYLAILIASRHGFVRWGLD